MVNAASTRWHSSQRNVQGNLAPLPPRCSPSGALQRQTTKIAGGQFPHQWVLRMLARGVRSDAWAAKGLRRWLRVAVGVSGGVDSSVAALLLQRHVRALAPLCSAFPGRPRALFAGSMRHFAQILTMAAIMRRGMTWWACT